MEKTRRKPGRPPGLNDPRKLPVYDTVEGIRLLQELARQRGVSAAALLRLLIREEAVRQSVAVPAEEAVERREAARERLLALLNQSQAHAAASGLTPEELEREVTLAHDEARELLRARGD